jgi:KTSC domain
MPMFNSSAISRASYDPSSAQLHITFHSGRTYTFYRVPPAIYHGLLTASSAGRYYHAYIRGRFGP